MPKVVVGIIKKTERNSIGGKSDEGMVLLGQRPKNARYALKWEFPGGKVEEGESSEQALVRELSEELDLDVQSFQPYLYRQNTYPDGKIFDVEYYLVDWIGGELKNNAFEELRWVKIKELAAYDLLQGNMEVVKKLQEDYAGA